MEKSPDIFHICIYLHAEFLEIGLNWNLYSGGHAILYSSSFSATCCGKENEESISNVSDKLIFSKA